MELGRQAGALPTWKSGAWKRPPLTKPSGVNICTAVQPCFTNDTPLVLFSIPRTSRITVCRESTGCSQRTIAAEEKQTDIQTNRQTDGEN